MTLQERFDSKWMPEPNSGCWIWTASRGSKMGYGMLVDRQKSQYAHRVSWQLHQGEIPEGMHVLHRCDTPLCVNPSHLFLGTNDDNVQDRNRKCRFFTTTHCPKCGGDYEQYPSGRKYCRPCTLRIQRERRAR